jgi:hypothetical protein
MLVVHKAPRVTMLAATDELLLAGSSLAHDVG